MTLACRNNRHTPNNLTFRRQWGNETLGSQTKLMAPSLIVSQSSSDPEHDDNFLNLPSVNRLVQGGKCEPIFRIHTSKARM